MLPQRQNSPKTGGEKVGGLTPAAVLCREVWREMETMLPTAAISVDTVRVRPRRREGLLGMFIWSGVWWGLAVGAPMTRDMSMFCCSSIRFRWSSTSCRWTQAGL